MADERIQYNEEMVGAGHPAKADTLNRLALAAHNTDGTHKSWVDVKEYGAAGDGATDDTAVIQTAIDTGKPVYIPFTAAHYRITGEVIVSTEGQTIFGDGNLSLIKQYTNNMNLFRVTADRVKITGLALEGTSTGTESNLPASYGAGVVLYEVQGCEVSGNYFKNCSAPTQAAGAAVWLTGARNCGVFDNIIDGSYIGINSDGWITDGISYRNQIRGNIVFNVKHGYYGDFQGAQQANHIGDIVESNVFYFFTSSAITVDRATRFSVNGNHITGVKGDANYDAQGIAVIKGSKYGTINANIIGNCGDNGIVLNDVDGSPVRYISVTGNSINNCDQDGIQLYTCAQISIVGNTITNNGRHGIRSVSGDYPRAVAISGNTIYMNSQHGILLYDPQSFTLSGNIISRNGQAASNTYDGVYAGAVNLTMQGVMIGGNIFHDANTDGAETQRYAVNVSGAYTGFSFTHNVTSGQVSGALNDSSGGVFKIGNTDDVSARILKISGKYHHGSTTAPTSGTWAAGDIVYNIAPSAGGFLGWVCTAAGTPGTWKTFGAISA